jgi:hypothetical protein
MGNLIDYDFFVWLGINNDLLMMPMTENLKIFFLVIIINENDKNQ